MDSKFTSITRKSLFWASIASKARKNMRATNTKGARTSAQEINPSFFLHRKFKNQPYRTTKIAFTNKVAKRKFLRKADKRLIPARIR